MKLNFIYSIVFLMLITACSNNNSTNDKTWTNAQKDEFKVGCENSLWMHYNMQKIEVDANYVTTICNCTQETIAAEYGYKDAKHLSKDKVWEITNAAMKKCAPDTTIAPKK